MAEPGEHRRMGKEPSSRGARAGAIDDALMMYWQQRLSKAEIAVLLNTSVKAVEVRASRLGLTRRAADDPLSGEAPLPNRRGGPVKRRCISCGKPFMSEHIGNRICQGCKTDISDHGETAWISLHIPLPGN